MQPAIINQELRNFILTNFLFGTEKEIREEQSLMEQGIIDSTGVLELIAFLEERYGITVEDRELLPENLDSIVAIVSYLLRKGVNN